MLREPLANPARACSIQRMIRDRALIALPLALLLGAALVLAGAAARPAAPSPAGAAASRPAPATRPEPGRFILLDGGRNFRDAGGYRTADGRTVRRGLFYRSGSLGRLTPAGEARLESLAIRAIVDLRSTEERASDTNARLASAGMGYWARDYAFSQGNVVALMRDPANHSPAAARAIMLDAYRNFPREQAPGYRELFARLAAGGKGAVVVNCSAGKDRSGLATALVLTALGVPYATVRRDFLLSNGAPGMASLAAAMAGVLPPGAVQPLLGVEPAYLDAAFAQIRHDHGSVNGYLRRELGVGPAQIRQLRARLLR